MVIIGMADPLMSTENQYGSDQSCKYGCNTSRRNLYRQNSVSNLDEHGMKFRFCSIIYENGLPVTRANMVETIFL